jgi:hypothetical protein
MRRERDWSAVQAWENLHGLFGMSVKSTAVYKAIEQGIRAIGPEEDEALRAYFGKGPDGAAGVQPVEEVSLARAIKALADEIHALRTEDRIGIVALERAAILLGRSSPFESEVAALLAPPVRQESAE